MSQAVTSRITVKANGEILLTRRGFTFRKGGIQRAAVNGDSGLHGYTEEAMGARLTGNVTATEKSELDSYDVTDATIQIETNTGQTYVMRNAFMTDLPELDTDQGQFGVAFEGPEAEKL